MRTFAALLGAGVAALMVSLTAVTIPCAYAQQQNSPSTGGPRWEQGTADDLQKRPLRGAINLRVTADPVATRPAGVRFSVRITRTNQTLPCDRLPATLRWDTTSVPDGWNWAELVMTDATGKEAIIDSLKVYIANGEPDRKDLPVPPAPSVSTTSASITPTPTVSSPAPAVPARGRLSSRGGGGRRSSRRQTPAALVLPDRVEPARVDAFVTDSAAPFSAPTTALCRAGDRIAIGLPDGGVAMADTEGHQGRAVRLPADARSSGPARVLAASSDGRTVYWLAGNADIVYCYQERDRSVRAFDVSVPDSGPWIERLTVLGGRVALLGDGVARLLDPKSGELAPLTNAFPSEIASTITDEGGRLFLAADGDNGAVIALTVGGTSGAHLWTASRLSSSVRDWSDRGEIGLPSDLDFGDAHDAGSGRRTLTATLALAPNGFALLGGGDGQPVQVGLSKPMSGLTPFQPADLPTVVDDNPNAPQRPRRVALGGSGIWWEENGIVQHTDPYSGRREAYMPWNGAGNDVRALVADRDGLWVATDRGVQHITPDHPGDTEGYGGYVRATLGTETATPQTDRDRKIAALVEEWQGVPYKWGGESKKGTDCSGFVCSVHHALGVSLPRSSSEMGKGDAGHTVRDELRYGDVLVYPGHVALYIGNGRTAETVGGTPTGSVGKASIWRRRDVVVKRFWP